MSEAPDDPLVALAIEEPGWEIALPEIREVATRAAALALDVAGLSPDACSVSVLACDDVRIAALNAAFRGKAGPTNVLSWPAFPLAPPRPGEAPPAPPAASAHGARLPLGMLRSPCRRWSRKPGNSVGP